MLSKSNDPRWQHCAASVHFPKKLNGHDKAVDEILTTVEQYYQGNDIDDLKLRTKSVNVVLEYLQQFLNKGIGVFKTTVNRSIETKVVGIVDYISVISDTHTEVIVISNEYKNATMLDNIQLLIALTYTFDLNPGKQTLVMTVIQPNCPTKVINQYITRRQLEEIMGPIFTQLESINQGNKCRVANEYCKICGDNEHCEALKQSKTEVTMQHELIVAKCHSELETMSETDLGAILTAEEIFKDAFTKARLQAMERIQDGKVIPGWHIASGNKASSWNEDPEIIAKKLKGMKVVKDKIYPSKLISPAQARKLQNLTDIQRTNLEKLITEIEGKPKLKKNEFDAPIPISEISFI